MRIGITKTNRKPVPNYYNNFKILIQRQKYSFCFKPQSRVPRQRRRTKLPDTSILATELKKKKKKKRWNQWVASWLWAPRLVVDINSITITISTHTVLAKFVRHLHLFFLTFPGKPVVDDLILRDIYLTFCFSYSWKTDAVESGGRNKGTA